MPEITPHPGIEACPDQLVAEIEDTPDGRQCTIFPTNLDDADLVTTWITADEDSFVALTDVR